MSDFEVTTTREVCQWPAGDGLVCGEPAYRILDDDGFCCTHFRPEVDRRATEWSATHRQRDTRPWSMRLGQAEAIRALRKRRVPVREIAQSYGISRARVYQILSAGATRQTQEDGR